MEETSPDPRKAAPPYAPYKTFRKFLTNLRTPNKLPARIDRSVMSGMSGGTQSQLVGALRFFDLIKPNGTPTPRLVEFAADEQGWETKWPDIVRSGYAFIFSPLDSEFGIDAATTSQLAELFRKAGVSGATVTKCMQFFVSATKEANISISPHIVANRTTQPRGPGGKRKTTAASKKASVVEIEAEDELPEVDAANTKSIELVSGGELSLTLSVNLFSLSANDRTFVFGLIDEIEKYERRKGIVEPKEEAGSV